MPWEFLGGGIFGIICGVMNTKHAILALAAVAASLLAVADDADGTALLHLSHVHRGGGKLERPDNTLSTFLWCWGNGSALECDVKEEFAIASNGGHERG